MADLLTSRKWESEIRCGYNYEKTQMEDRGPDRLLYDEKWKWEVAREIEGRECLKANNVLIWSTKSKPDGRQEKILGGSEKLWRPFWDSSLILGSGRWKE